jgi:hypothetical protein
MNSQEEFLRESRAHFSVVGPAVSEDEVDAAFPGSFHGKDDLVHFYMQNNGGSRTPAFGVIHCGNPEHRVTRGHLEKIQVEGFFSIQKDATEKLLGFRSQSRYHASRSQTFREVPEIKLFLEYHVPVAFDHGGNDFWIDLKDGHIYYMLWDSWREGPIDFASSFREFVAHYWNRPHLLYKEHQFGDGIRQFENATGLKYDTEEAIQEMARRRKERPQ